MSGQGGPADFWLSRAQLLLLQATLSPRDAAQRAFQTWRGQVCLDTLDGPSHRLLPLLYRQLVAWEREDPWLARLRGTHRKAWFTNKLLLQEAARLSGLLESAGLPTLLLKGAALVLKHYPDEGLRTMDDVDIQLPLQRAGRAWEVLHEAGWQSIEADGAGPPVDPQALSARCHAWAFTNPRRHGMFDLHWHVFGNRRYSALDEAVRERAQAIRFHGVNSRVLCPADSLLHVCVHGARWAGGCTLRWIADACTIIASSPSLDWDRLLRLSLEHRLVLHLRRALEFLQRRFQARFPEGVLRALRTSPVTSSERLEHYMESAPRTQREPLYTLSYRTVHYSQTLRDSGPLPYLRGLPGYLRHIWQLRRSAELPLYALGRTLETLKLMGRALGRKSGQESPG